MERTTGGPVRSGQERSGRGASGKGTAVRRIVSVSDFYGPMHCGYCRDRQLECLVRYRASGQRRCCNADERAYEHSAVLVIVIQHWHIRRMMRVRMRCPMHMDRPTVVMVGGMVVWMGVRQRSAHCGTLDGHRQRQGKRLTDHGHIVGERGHLVKTYGRRTELCAASFLNEASGRWRARRTQLHACCQPKRGRN